MELFYSAHFQGNKCYLEADDAVHCTRVLRHKAGDTIHVIDGHGTLYQCVLTEISRDGATAEITGTSPRWGAHSYNLTLAVCPTKNNERFEWFVEKAVELGVDRIVPLIGDRSERKVYKTERAKRIALSAAKQSLKAAIPEISEPVSVRDFIQSLSEGESSREPAPGATAASTAKSDSARPGTTSSSLRLIAYCFEGERPRVSIKEALSAVTPPSPTQQSPQPEVTVPQQTQPEIAIQPSAQPEVTIQPSARPDITILIGPEGDFSLEEATLALEAGFLPIHLGPSRLRTETAALAAVAAVYMQYSL